MKRQVSVNSTITKECKLHAKERRTPRFFGVCTFRQGISEIHVVDVYFMFPGILSLGGTIVGAWKGISISFIEILVHGGVLHVAARLVLRVAHKALVAIRTAEPLRLLEPPEVPITVRSMQSVGATSLGLWLKRLASWFKGLGVQMLLHAVRCCLGVQLSDALL